ncbi:phage integrase [Aureimonas endophytica]|uniref:Phage integrase n=1 Tax=Aureimonas endophytica TaxID=2027858 RepID=A0A917E139_9HYPH|nr:integrase [Aureimonas endophytica]GGD88000.1 phage integrase [Aureimonas endophytica]
MASTKPARLYLVPERRDENGWIRQNSVWMIRDGKVRILTKFGPEQRREAEGKLAEYLVERNRKASKGVNRAAADVAIADVLQHYEDEAGRDVARPKELKARLARLGEFWGDRMLSEVTGYTCKQYARHRSTPGAARRELEDFKAAIRLYCEDGLCRELVVVKLPPKGDSRQGWMTRGQVAALLWFLLTYRTTQRGRKTRRRSLRHILPFVLVAVYTGSRSSRIWNASFEKEDGRPWIDLETGIFYRVGEAEKRYDNKRADPIRLPERLLHLLRIWQRGPLRIDGYREPRRYLVEWQGRPVDPKKGLVFAMKEVFGADHGFVRHSFRHTCASWLIQDPDQDEKQIAKYLSMSVDMLRKVYGHLHPDADRDVGQAFSSGRAGRRGQPRGHRFGRGETKREREEA